MEITENFVSETQNFSEVKDAESWIKRKNEIHRKLGESERAKREDILKELHALAKIRDKFIFEEEPEEDESFWDNWIPHNLNNVRESIK